jgi:hypothetical protein
VPAQFPRKFKAVASPNVKARSWLLTYSPPRSQAYGAGSHLSANSMLCRWYALTICHVEKGEQRNEGNNDSASTFRARIDRPRDGRHQLTNGTGRNANQHHGASVDQSHEEEADQHTDQACAGHQDGV